MQPDPVQHRLESLCHRWHGHSCLCGSGVSCSPYRVPIARLAAALAAITGGKTETLRTV